MNRLKPIFAYAFTLFVAIEMIGLLYFLKQTGKIFYADRSAIVQARTMHFSLNEKIEPEGRFRLDPYVGFGGSIRRREIITNEGAAWDIASVCADRLSVLCSGDKMYLVTNNFGYDSVLDYPFKKPNDNTFIIGVFGGSVAKSLTATANPHLIRAFRSLPELKGRDVVVLSFAMEAYKQPQQLQALSLFLAGGQQFDLVINVDGVNEILHVHSNVSFQAHPSMPSIGQMRAALARGRSPELIRALTAIREQQRQAIRRLQRSPLSSLGAAHDLFATILDARRNTLIKADLSQARDNSEIGFVKSDNSLSPDRAFAEQVDIWVRGSILMALIAENAGAKYIHVLPPNPYFSRKPMTEEERRRLRWDLWYGPATRDGYAALLQAGSKLAAAGVQFANATAIFDQTTDMMFSDECCHMFPQGNNALSDFIVAEYARAHQKSK